MAVKRTLDVVGVHEVAQMFDVEVTRVPRWRKEGKLPPPYFVLRCSPVWLRSDIKKVRAGKKGFTEPLEGDPPLLGTAEVSDLLGVHKSQISRWRREPARFGPRFPEPTTKIKASPLWDRQTILEFGQEKAAA